MPRITAMARLLIIALLACAPMSAPAETAPGRGHDFEWQIGSWDTHVRVRAPFSTEDAWAEFRGTSIVHAFAEGRANLVELDVANAAQRIQGVSLRLHNPQTGQWSINFANMRDGMLTAPLYGGFENGTGVFYGQDAHEGRVVLVRFVISDTTSTSARFVQSYSADGGLTWIDNWIAVDTRN